jgi:ribonuclease BN (tRNA processing enzyme)
VLFGDHHRPDRLTVTVLGSAGSFGHPGNACSGYLVRTETTAVWLDCGPGTLSVLQEHVAVAELDAVIVSHEHPDHWLELPVLRNAARYVLGVDHLPVYGTAGTRALFEHVAGGKADPIDWTVVTDGSAVTIDDVSFSFAATDHPVETLAVRADAHGRTFVYSADTGPAWSLASLDPTGAGFDLAFCEATLAEADAGAVQHLTGTQAGRMARAAGVRRLALTHLYEDTGPDRAEAAATAEAFDGPVEVALPGHVFTV